MQFASHADLAARLRVALDAEEQSQADTLLTIASGLIQREARQTISQVPGDVLTVPGTPETRLRLPERPVVSVASAVLNGTSLTVGDGFADTYYLAGGFLVRWRGWDWPWHTVVVTYTHGYAVVPDAIRAVCLEAVVRVWVNPANTMHDYSGSLRTVFAMQATPTGLMLNDEEKRVIHDVLRRTSGNVALR